MHYTFSKKKTHVPSAHCAYIFSHPLFWLSPHIFLCKYLIGFLLSLHSYFMAYVHVQFLDITLTIRKLEGYKLQISKCKTLWKIKVYKISNKMTKKLHESKADESGMMVVLQMSMSQSPDNLGRYNCQWKKKKGLGTPIQKSFITKWAVQEGHHRRLGIHSSESRWI